MNRVGIAGFVSGAVPLLLVGLVACLGPEDRIPTQREPGYYVGARFVALTVDSSALILEADSQPESLVRGALSRMGFVSDSVTLYYLMRNHWKVWLPVMTPAAAASDAARLLRLTPGIRFASVAYRLRGYAPCGITLINRLTVLYRPGVTREAIQAINARVGATYRPDGLSLGGAWTLAYPVGTSHTPLEVALYFARHRLVEWAEPDRADCFNVLNSSRQE